MSDNLKDTLKELNKLFGEGAVGFASKNENIGIETWDTNCFSLNRILGNGGLAKGRVYELFGLPSGGKSTAALFLVAQIQKQGGAAAYIDAEFTFNDEHAAKIGVDMDKLIFAQPSSGEEAFKIIDELIHTGALSIIVVDSSAALVPQKELDGEIEDSNVALQARMMSKGLRVLTGAIAKTKTIVIFISQTRAKIGMFAGPSTDSTGGNAVKFYASVRLDVKGIKALKEGEETVGNRLKITAVKNKVATPFRSAEVDLYFQSGFDLFGDTLDYGEQSKVIQKIGNTYSFGAEKIGVGRSSSIENLKNNSKLYASIREKIKETEDRGKETKNHSKNGS